jgi:hypothetical protein
MRITNASLRGRRVFVAVTGLTLTLASSATAQDAFRWKFQKGDKFGYGMVQEMSIASPGVPGAPQNVTMSQDLGMTWEVQDVTKDEDAVIQLKIDSVKMKMIFPAPVGEIAYDSTSEKPPAGPAASLAPICAALTKAPFTITMSFRGEMKDAKIPEEFVAAIKSTKNPESLEEISTPEGFKRMMQQGLIEFPEDASLHQKEWTKTVPVVNTAGKQVVETSVRFKEVKEVEGQKIAVFEPSVKMNFDASQVKVTEQSSKGEILFNVDQGRMTSLQKELSVTFEEANVGQTKIGHKIEVKVTPAVAEAGEKAAEAAEAEEVKQ